MATGWPMKTTYADGDVYSAQDVNDITGTINLLGSSVAYSAGKNKVINGDFNINQRGFTSTTGSGVFTFDRWRTQFVGGTVTYSTQAFTAGTAPVSGYESTNFARVVISGQTNTGGDLAIWNHRIEGVRTFAGQTATISFWAKASSGTPKISTSIEQNFGSGGSGTVYVYGTAPTISTSWARYSITVSVPSISGKTIGTSNYLQLNVEPSNAYNTNLGFQNGTFDIWGVQMEAGSTATAFQTATGTIQGELAACQRYYFRNSATSVNSFFGYGISTSTTAVAFALNSQVTMRVAPTSIDYSTIEIHLPGVADYAFTTLTLDSTFCTNNTAYFNVTGASGLTTSRTYELRANNSSSAYVGFSAEL
jgi:hypothetical protein